MAVEKLVFPVGFDTSSGKDDAKKDVKDALNELQDIVNKHPLKVKMEISKEDRQSMNDFATIIRKMSNNAKQGSKDLNTFKAKMAELNKQWDKLSASERSGVKGNLLRQQYRDLAREAGGYTSTLQASVKAEDRANQALEKKRAKLRAVNKEYSDQDGYITRLIKRLGLYTALAAGVRFVKNIREVTAEFELQRVSLGALIQDAERANQLFDQIKVAAVKSPYEIKDLVKYTKQLAAYKIETEDLFDTMMRLSDISAGLGTDMSRIVLAYGQIKGAGVLKGTELRQITELGIPMVDLLAKKLTDLRGELVTTGEVFKLISEKAISFSTVKEIFDDMTNAGGMFYKMQEKQAETLAGRWSNLKDSISIMYEEMGNTKVASDAMDGIIKTLKSLANNWKTVYDLVAGATYGLVAYVVATKAATVATTALTVRQALEVFQLKNNAVWIPRAITALMSEARAKTLAIAMSKRLRNARVAEATATGLVSKAVARLRVALLSNPYGLAIAAIVALGAAIFNFTKHAKTAKESAEELNATVADIQNKEQSVGVLVKRYEELSQKVNRTAEEEKELKRVTRQLSDSYPAAIESVKEYGKELGISAEKARLLYEAELNLSKSDAEKQLDKNRRKLVVLQAQYGGMADQLISGYKSVYTKSGVIKLPMTHKEVIRLKERMDETAESIKAISSSIENAEITLGIRSKDAVSTASKAMTAIQTKLKEFKVAIKSETGEDVQLFQDEEILAMSTQADAIAKAVEIYKDRDEKVKTLTKSLENLTPEQKKETEASIATSKAYQDAAYAALEYFNALGKLEGKDEGAGKRLRMLQEEVKLLEQVYNKYKEYNKYMSSEQAKAKTEQYFGNTIQTLRFGPAFDERAMVEILQKYQSAMKKLPKSEKAVMEIGFKADEVAWSEFQRDIKERIKQLSDNISQTREAQSFFNDMIGLTGDKELSANLTMSIYGIDRPEGDLGSAFAKSIAEDMQRQIQQYLGDIDISGAINEQTKEIDPIKLKSIVEGLDPDTVGKENIDAVKQLVDEMIKGNASYVKTLYEGYKKFLDYEHQKTIVAQREAEVREKIAKNTALSEDEKKKLTQASFKRQTEETLSIDVEEFKASDQYVKAFEDIDRLSTATITRLLRLLDEFRKKNASALAENPEQMKALMTEYNKLYDGIIARNPFKAVVKGLKEYATATYNVKAARKDLKKAEDSGDYDTVIKKQKTLSDALDEQKAALYKVEKGFKNASDAISNLSSTLSNVVELLGLAEDSDVAVFVQELVKWFGMLSTVLGTIASVIAIIEAEMAPLLMIASAIAAIGAAVSFFTGAKARKANKEIEELSKTIDDLSYAYERLEAAQEKSLGSEYIQNHKKRMQTLLAEQQAYLEQAELERSKGKKADEDKIKDYEDNAREAADRIKDSVSEVQDYLAGTDITSAARDFASAWVDAYKEFSSTSDAIEEKFYDMIQNMVVEGIAASLVKNILDPIYKQIKEIASDGTITTDEIASVADQVPGAVDSINNALTVVFEKLKQAGYDVRKKSTGLTGISKDIASASEESILGLSAGINTQNFYISQIHANVAAILAKIGGGNIPATGGVDMKTLVDMQNSHLSYLPVIAQHTSDILVRCERAATACENLSKNINRIIVPRGSQSSYQVGVTLN